MNSTPSSIKDFALIPVDSIKIDRLCRNGIRDGLGVSVAFKSIVCPLPTYLRTNVTLHKEYVLDICHKNIF